MKKNLLKKVNIIYLKYILINIIIHRFNKKCAELLEKKVFVHLFKCM